MKTLAVAYTINSFTRMKTPKHYKINEPSRSGWHKAFTIAAVVGWISFGVVVVRPDWIVNLLFEIFT